MEFSSLARAAAGAFPGMTLKRDEPLARHCSFRIGGPAALMALPRSAEELTALCGFFAAKGCRPLLLGNGTDLLFPDAGLRRVVIKTGQCARIEVEEGRVTAECGASLARAASAAADAGLTGLEFAHGIPGSVGGAVLMNAGAYGGQLADAVVQTEYLDGELAPRVLRGAEHDFSYRHSAFSSGEYVILRCVLSLAPGRPEEITARMRELAARRRESQPLDLPSAGSAFKRPEGGYAAALIDGAGLRGFSVGGAQVSEKHAGFIVNTGGATQDDVLRLMEHIQRTVYSRSGIALEPEIRVVRE